MSGLQIAIRGNEVPKRTRGMKRERSSEWYAAKWKEPRLITGLNPSLHDLSLCNHLAGAYIAAYLYRSLSAV